MTPVFFATVPTNLPSATLSGKFFILSSFPLNNCAKLGAELRIKEASAVEYLQRLELGPKAEGIYKPVNPFEFLGRLILGALAATYYVLVSIYMWIKDQIIPKGQPT